MLFRSCHISELPAYRPYYEKEPVPLPREESPVEESIREPSYEEVVSGPEPTPVAISNHIVQPKPAPQLVPAYTQITEGFKKQFEEEKKEVKPPETRDIDSLHNFNNDMIEFMTNNSQNLNVRVKLI